MNFTANTRPPRQPKREGGISWTWIFFLLILARPLWGIVRSLVGPQISDEQLWLMIGGVIVLGVVTLLITRIAQSRPPAARLPTPSVSAQPMRQMQMPSRAGAGYPTRPPQFEPIITGKVLLAGLVLAALIVGGAALVAFG